MADHYRSALRSAITSRLTGLATSQDRIFPNRIYPLQGDDLPGITLRIQEPEITVSTIHGPAVYERKASVMVRCYAAFVTDLDAALDAMNKEVEVALATAVTVAGKSVELSLRGIQVEAVQADKPVGMVEMTYETVVYTHANAPDVLL